MRRKKGLFPTVHVWGVLLAIMLFGAVRPAEATTVITLDEIPASNNNAAVVSEEYSHLGVHFATDDGVIWGGNSNGNPGNWGLEGTNGPHFLGFNGSSYALTATFDVPISDIFLDVARSNGSSPQDTFTLEAYQGANLVDSKTVLLDLINQWTTVSLNVTNVDRLEWRGNGTGFHPYGVDNFSFIRGKVIPEPMTMLAVGLSVAGLSGYIRKRKRC